MPHFFAFLDCIEPEPMPAAIDFYFEFSSPYGYFAAEDKVHIHDLHATILHLMGLNHEQLTFRYSGRDFRLTDVHGRVVEELIA